MIDLNFSVTLNAPDGELAVIRARGADAGSFLQGQLTQDVLLMNTTEARLAAWCSAKGRMLASFIVVKLSAEEFLLILSRDLLAATLKRLKMFVLRAKCELADISGEVSVEGLLGSVASDASSAMNLEALRAYSMPASGQKASENLIILPAGHLAGQAVPRALRIRLDAPPASADATQLATWNALEITSGIARLSAAVSEAFVPQMLNYESVGGVNFKKGCYPGQEVVARSQFRGTLKRRGYIVTCAQALQAGQEVFDSREPDQPGGQIAQAAAHPEGGFVAIVSMQTAAESSPALHAGSPDGALLQLQALPYALLADV
jgi:tRNA-modifying protein YgfZ